MKITPNNILQHELIGLHIILDEYTERGVPRLTGTVIDETRNTLLIENTHKNEKRIAKAGNRFIFELDEGVRVRVKGERLISRPEDRIKKA